MTAHTRIEVDLGTQTLRLFVAGRERARYAISSARRGAGERKGSEQTPRGLHVVRAKIGAGLPSNAVLVGRRPTGEIWSPQLHADHPDRDWILTRILWLSGVERGRNRLGDVDSMQRFIYIHGTPDAEAVGQPDSHGCIRMRNADVIELYDAVPVGTPVHIVETRSS
jgi:lipoprotein-anchoring transpeptidase ErfK/SrfK